MGPTEGAPLSQGLQSKQRGVLLLGLGRTLLYCVVFCWAEICFIVVMKALMKRLALPDT